MSTTSKKVRNRHKIRTKSDNTKRTTSDPSVDELKTNRDLVTERGLEN